MLACLSLNASANPPARLAPPPLTLLFGVSRPLPPFVPVAALLLLAMLRPLSLGAGGGAGFFAPTAGRFAGGAGGVGLALMPGRAVPFDWDGVPLMAVELGTVRAVEGGGGGRETAGCGAGASSWR